MGVYETRNKSKRCFKISSIEETLTDTMCSVGADNFEDLDENKYMVHQKPFKLLENRCNKCKENVSNVVLRNKDAYCKDCFLAATTHKFKALLGKHRLIKHNDMVLVCLDGGHGSAALLHFLRSGLDLNTPKRLKFQPIFVYIDDKYNLCEDSRINLMKSIRDQATNLKFPLYFVSLAEYIEKKFNVNVHRSPADIHVSHGDKEIIDKLHEQANETNKNEIFRIFRQRLLFDTAKHLSCKSVLTTELALDTATRLLTGVSLGYGSNLPLDVGVCDTRDAEVTLIRPLRLFDIKELAFYNHFCKLDVIATPQMSKNKYSSIQSLISSFVSDLQVNFPATVTTIVRTGDKLSTDTSQADDLCSLCRAPKGRASKDLRSEESTNFSHWMSTQTPDYKLLPIERYRQAITSFFNSDDSAYCYACSRLTAEV